MTKLPRLPDGAAVSPELAAALAGLPVLKRGRWDLTEGPPLLRGALKALGFARDVPLVELDGSASQDHFLVLDQARRFPVLGWEKEEAWVKYESVLDLVAPPSPPPAKATVRAQAAGAKPPRARAAAAGKPTPALPKVGRIKPPAPDAFATLPAEEVRRLGRGVLEPINKALLKQPGFVGPLLAALGRAGDVAQAFEVVRAHMAQWRNTCAVHVQLEALPLAATSRDPAACELMFREYARCIGRDATDYHGAPHLHVAALDCAEVLGQQARALDLIARAVEWVGGVPPRLADEPRLAPLWERPALKPLYAAYLATSARAAKGAKARRRQPG